MSETVNFWDYATNEYCLDSFICYLLRIEKTKKAFFKLCEIDENEKIQNNGIRQQNKNVDVLIETSNSFLIIEDKVDSSEHDNQLKKYIQAVKNENEKGKEITNYSWISRNSYAVFSVICNSCNCVCTK